MNEYIIGASLPEFDAEEDLFKKQDPFVKSWEDLKNLNGLDVNFKRRSTRQISKLDTNSNDYLDSAMAVSAGINGAKSKELNPGKVFKNGYGLFDVITPPWNLYELANYYDTSFANHAAIDAKVENIVGLGYDFHVTDRTSMRLEGMEDQTAIKRARNRIERAKVELKDWLETLNDEDSFTHTMMKIYTDLQATGNGYMEIGRTVTGEIG